MILHRNRGFSGGLDIKIMDKLGNCKFNFGQGESHSCRNKYSVNNDLVDMYLCTYIL